MGKQSHAGGRKNSNSDNSIDLEAEALAMSDQSGSPEVKVRLTEEEATSYFQNEQNQALGSEEFDIEAAQLESEDAVIAWQEIIAPYRGKHIAREIIDGVALEHVAFADKEETVVRKWAEKKVEPGETIDSKYEIDYVFDPSETRRGA
ncbi:hypothetical protein [Aeoliella sp.]|uniref:hypothetical protein n=1 Tax=Aeoliella sp. TaxID=2795800 RepID=UPI003CCBA52F